jgi:hypothetical protein
LTQNDKEKDDLMVLKSIKYLQERGYFDEPEASAASAVETNDQPGYGHDPMDYDG